MKYITKLLGLLLASIALAACGGGGSVSAPVKTEKVWKLVKKETMVLGKAVVFTFEYDGSGLLEKMTDPTFGTVYNKFVYDAEGVLVNIDRYNDLGEIKYRTEFDKYGEATARREGSLLKKDILYKNKYPEGLIVDKKEIQKYVQRKILQTKYPSEVSPYLGSKLVSRERGITVERIEEFDFSEANKRITDIYEYPDDRTADKQFVSIFDKYGIRLFNGDEFDYEEEHGNLKTATHKVTGDQIHYEWEQMDIPVE